MDVATSSFVTVRCVLSSESLCCLWHSIDCLVMLLGVKGDSYESFKHLKIFYDCLQPPFDGVPKVEFNLLDYYSKAIFFM
jgi:hypothetical protein